MVSADIRRHARQVIASSMPWLRVVSYAELLPDIDIDLLAQVGLPDYA